MKTLWLITDVLRSLGYSPVGNGVFCGHGLRCETSSDWLTWTSPQPVPNPDSLLEAMTGPLGPWKPSCGAGEGRWACHLPRCVLPTAAALELEEDPAATLHQILAWPGDAWHGPAPRPHWPSPDPELLAERIPPAALRIQTGSYVRQGWVDSGSGRLSVQVPLAPLSPALTGPRRAALLDILAHASRLRLIRVGVDAVRQDNWVVARIDLSGMPLAISEEFLAVSIDGLRWVAERLIEPVSFVAGAARQSQALDEQYAA